MRIAQLDLKAFGHFSDRRIVFAGGGMAGGGDFHIAYGPNEAGKTTISRALKAALFGVPERTTDNHRHANPSLRVGVVLAAENGEQLAVMRRKARKNSLLRYDAQSGEELGEAIADELLSQWLGGLSEGLYTSMFGLDHDELVAGGKALSEGKGELGQSLFEAGAGLSSIRALRERLAKEADDLFRPRASSSAIFRELDHYAVARRAARDAQTRPAEWETLRKHADEAGSAYDAARRQQESLQRDARRLERLAAVLPDIAARALARERLAALGEVRRLPADAPGERIAAETRWRQAELAQNDATDKLSRQQAELAAITLPQALLQEGGALEALYYALDAFRGARETAVRAKGTMAQADRRSAALLAAMGEALRGEALHGESLRGEALHGESLCDDPRSLIPGVTLRARVQSQVTGGATLRAEHDAASRLAATTRRELDELNGEIGELGSPQVPVALLAAIDAFDAEGNPELSAQAATRQVASLEAALLREAAALGEGSPAALAAIGTPLPAEVQQFRSRRDALEMRKQTLSARIEGVENDMAAVNGELAGLLRQGEVPTVEQLGARRAHRESLWQTIRRRLFAEAGADTNSKNQLLAALPSAAECEECEEYEQAVNAADATADRRFADAARVAQHADLLKRLAQMGNALDLERGRLAAAGHDGNELATQWQALLAKYALPALDAAELADWLNKRDVFLQRYGACADVQSHATAAATRAASVRAELSAALRAAVLPACSANETLAQAVGRARIFVEKAGQAASSQKILARKKMHAEEKLAAAQAQIAACTARLDAWRAGWSASMAAIRLAGDAGSEEASARLGQFEELEQALDTLDAARAELAGAEATLARVEQEVERLSAALGYVRATRPADAVIETFYEQLGAARGLAARCRTLTDLIDEAGKTGAQAGQALQLAVQDLARLKSAAGCATLAELIDAEQRSAECLALEAAIGAIEGRLVASSALALHELLAQAAGQDLALVQAALERVGSDLAACNAQVETLHRQQIEALAALGTVDGEALAADAEQQAADAAARLSTLVADYASARLASTILAEAIDTYQQRYQGPLLARASELFARITGGRFVRVATDFSDEMTILVGVRPNGKRENVGNLSSGTRDQLFLALRLAAIERHVVDREPMPVVVDDIVINFDDASASATFEVLAELSHKTQVLFFTHHEHLLERASDAIGAAAFSAHRL